MEENDPRNVARFATNPFDVLIGTSRRIDPKFFRPELIESLALRTDVLEKWDEEQGRGLIKFVMNEGVTPDYATSTHPTLASAKTTTATDLGQQEGTVADGVRQYLPKGTAAYVSYAMFLADGRPYGQSYSHNAVHVLLGHSQDIGGWHESLASFGVGEASWVKMNWSWTFGESEQIYAFNHLHLISQREQLINAMTSEKGSAATQQEGDAGRRLDADNGQTVATPAAAEVDSQQTVGAAATADAEVHSQQTVGAAATAAAAAAAAVDSQQTVSTAAIAAVVNELDESEALASCRDANEDVVQQQLVSEVDDMRSTPAGRRRVPYDKLTFKKETLWVFFILRRCLAPKSATMTQNHKTVEGLVANAAKYFSNSHQLLRHKPPRARECSKTVNKVKTEIFSSFPEFEYDPHLSDSDRLLIHHLLFKWKMVSLKCQLVGARAALEKCAKPKGECLPTGVQLQPSVHMRLCDIVAGSANMSQLETLEGIEEKIKDVLDTSQRLLDSSFCNGIISYPVDPAAVLYVVRNPPQSGYCKTPMDELQLLRLVGESLYFLGSYRDAATKILDAIKILNAQPSNSLKADWRVGGAKRTALAQLYNDLRAVALARSNQQSAKWKAKRAADEQLLQSVDIEERRAARRQQAAEARRAWNGS